MLKRCSASLALVIFISLLAACGNGGSSSKNYTIGLSLSTLTNPFFVGMDKGFRNEAATMKNITLVDTNANGDTGTQINQVENLITRHVDLIILNPVDSQAIVPVVQQANNAKIPVFTIDRGAGGGQITNFIETDNTALGVEGMDWIIQQLTKRNGSAKGNVVDLQGLRGTTPAENREKGFQQELQKNTSIKVVAMQAANFDQEKAYNVTTDILQANPQIDAIFCANDDTAIGAEKAIQAANRFFPASDPKHIYVIGIDGSEQALTSIRGSILDATISQNPLKMASKSLDLALQYLQGTHIDQHAFFPSKLITLDNINSQDVKDYGLWGDAAAQQ